MPNQSIPDSLLNILDRYSKSVEDIDRLIVRAAIIDAYFIGKFDGIDAMAKNWDESTKSLYRSNSQ